MSVNLKIGGVVEEARGDIFGGIEEGNG